MGLAHFEPETHEIKFTSKGKPFSFVVRGLNLVDLSYLVGEHLADIEAAWELFSDAQKEIIRRGSMDGLFLTLCRDAPGLVAEIISVAADEKDLVEQYAKLPFSISVTALAEVSRLTMVEAGGLKNLFASLANLIQSGLLEKAQELLGTQTSPQPGSTGESEKT